MKPYGRSVAHDLYFLRAPRRCAYQAPHGARGGIMRRATAAIFGLVLLTACGGGGGGVEPPPAPSTVAITANDVAPLDPTYRAVFDARVTVRITGQPLPFTLDGTLTIENEGADVEYPLDAEIDAQSLKHTLFLRIPATLRALLEQAAAGELGQDVSIPESISTVAREYIHVDADGRWFSIGGQIEDVMSTEVPAPTFVAWWAVPMLELESTMFPDQSFASEATDVLAEDLVTVVGTRANQRRIAPASTELDVLGRRYEVYVADVTETIAASDPSSDASTVTYRRWERPDLGLLRLHAEGYEVTVPTDQGDVTLRLETLDAVIVTLD